MPGCLPGKLLAFRFHYGGAGGESVRHPSLGRRDHAQQPTGRRVRSRLP